MPTIGAWIKRTVQQVWDPDREERIEAIAKGLLSDIQRQRNGFSIVEFASRIDCSTRELEAAKRKVYQIYLDRAWRDGIVAADERKALAWAVSRLEIPRAEADAELLKYAQDRFSLTLAQAMDDGHVDDSEARQLNAIASSVNLPLSEFVSQYFRSEGEGLLRGVFAACTQDGILARDAWLRLVETAERLGISRDALSAAIFPQAKKFIEHVLADAKSDGEFSDEEERQLLDLIQTIGLPAEASSYFNRTIGVLRTIRLAGQGILPVIEAPKGVAIRAGEIVHLHAPAKWFQRRILKSGDVWDEHVGVITVTDNRMLFSSNTKSFDVRFSSIISHSGHIGRIRLQRTGKPESIIEVSEFEPIAYAVLEGAVARANQTRLGKDDEARSRHIPREVRQRVWQRYGGQCAECGDAQYLEFDHVIPVAKGGSNSDANVQLLCRKCNLKKSDFI